MTNLKNPIMTSFVLLLTMLLTALITGLFYGYSCSVNPGLGRLPDREYLLAMQSINEAILNPLFFLSFMGTSVLLPVSAYISYTPVWSLRFICLLLAALVYIGGVLGVTMMGNVPLNEALARFNIADATDSDLAAQRLLFEKPWLVFHQIRTVSCVVALILAVTGCFFQRG